MKESHWIKRCGENITKHLFIAVLCIGIIAISALLNQNLV